MEVELELHHFVLVLLLNTKPSSLAEEFKAPSTLVVGGSITSNLVACPNHCGLAVKSPSSKLSMIWAKFVKDKQRKLKDYIVLQALYLY